VQKGVSHTRDFTALLSAYDIRLYFDQAPLDAGDWAALQNAPGPNNALLISDFEPGDAGIYKVGHLMNYKLNH